MAIKDGLDIEKNNILFYIMIKGRKNVKENRNF